MRRRKFNCSLPKLRRKKDTLVPLYSTILFYIRHIDARHLIQANSILFLSLDNGLEINSRLGHYKIHT
jgi:hypothetical protein